MYISAPPPISCLFTKYLKLASFDPSPFPLKTTQFMDGPLGYKRENTDLAHLFEDGTKVKYLPRSS